MRMSSSLERWRTMKVLICGSRNYRNAEAILKRMKDLPDDVLIIQGGAKGADSLAKMYAKDLGYDVVTFEAEWNVYGKAAGNIRNTHMLDKGQPTLVIAFVADPTHSPGTANMVLQALCAGIQVEVHQ